MLKAARRRADPGNVLWFIGIASVWSLVCLVAVALCVVAARADRALPEYAPADVAAPTARDDVGFVLVLAEPAPETAHEARPAARTPVH